MRRLLATLACLALLVTVLPAPALAAAPANDNVADAILLTGSSGSVTGDNTEATLETGEYDRYHSVWYKWTYTGRKIVAATFTTCGGAYYDTVLEVFTAGTTAPAGYADLTSYAYSDDACGSLQSRAAFLAEPGATYWIRLAGYWDSSYGAFTLAWSTVSPSSGALSLTLVNTPKDPLTCTLSVKGANLLENQPFSLIKGEWIVEFSTLAGRWSAEPVLLDKTAWGATAPGDLSLDPSTLLSGDGVSIVTPKIVNRCK